MACIMAACSAAQYGICFCPSQTKVRGRTAVILEYAVEAVQHSDFSYGIFHRTAASRADPSADPGFDFIRLFLAAALHYVWGQRDRVLL